MFNCKMSCTQIEVVLGQDMLVTSSIRTGRGLNERGRELVRVGLPAGLNFFCQ